MDADQTHAFVKLQVSFLVNVRNQQLLVKSYSNDRYVSVEFCLLLCGSSSGSILVQN